MSTTTNDAPMRQATLKALHEVIADTGTIVDRRHAIMMMAVRYGAARSVKSNPHVDWAIAQRARSRRFAALQRLVYASDQDGAR